MLRIVVLMFTQLSRCHSLIDVRKIDKSRGYGLSLVYVSKPIDKG